MSLEPVITAAAALQRLDGVAGILLFKGKHHIHRQMPFSEARAEELRERVEELLAGYRQVRRRVRQIYLAFDGGVLLVMTGEEATLVFFLTARADPDLAASAGSVLLADSGSRLVARLDLASKEKTTLASAYKGKRFNSPNDLVRRSDGAVFFTDPPYGLKGIDESPVKELDANGVYRIDADGSVHRLDAALRYPNGIALSPDERTLYVANSDPAEPVWIAYTLDAAATSSIDACSPTRAT